MPKIKLLPSLLSADFARLAEDAKKAEDAKADGLHCDIMDGHFVPNITFGPMVVKAVAASTKLPLYVHLMIENPDLYIAAFAKAGAIEILVHAEACVHLHRSLQNIKAEGVIAGVALNPHTPLDCLEYVLEDMQTLLIMTVNPGFGGQSFIDGMLKKIEKARKMAEKAGIELDIAVDGGIDILTAKKVVDAGANMLIAGSSVFANPLGVSKACEMLRKSVGG